MERRRFLELSAGAAAAVGVGSVALPARAQAWPARGPIKLVAQFPPGGLVDVMARLFAPVLSAELGQTVVVENRAGAAGVIGTDFVARQPADGYTLLISHAVVHVFAAAVRKTMPFDPIADFTHIGHLVEAPMVLLVRAQSPFQTLDQLLVAARSQPVRFGSSGVGSAPHLLGALLKSEGKAAQLDHIPYQGTAPGMQELLGGTIETFIDPVTTNVAQLRAGSLRALAVSSPQRMPALPNIPTFAEQGFPKLTAAQWLGLSAPKGLPEPIAARLAAIVPGMLKRPELVARFEETQTLPRNPGLMGDAFVSMIRTQMESWRSVARAANIELSS
jgi:tripartite-type tricarboxylate transporter receptor subunit TctC